VVAVNALECDALYPHDPTSLRRPQFALQRSIGDGPLYGAREPIHHHGGQKEAQRDPARGGRRGRRHGGRRGLETGAPRRQDTGEHAGEHA
jgi:hypothetical protein